MSWNTKVSEDDLIASGNHNEMIDIVSDISSSSYGHSSNTDIHFSIIDGLSDVDTTSDAPVRDECLKYNGTTWVPATYNTTFEFSIASFTDNEATTQLIGNGTWEAIGAITWNMTYNNGPPSSATMTISSDDGSYTPWTTNPQVLSSPYASDTSDEATNYPTVKDKYVRFTLNAGDGGSPDSDTETVTFRNYIYWGVANKNNTFSEADVEGLVNSVISNDQTRSMSINAGAGEYLVFSYPSTYTSIPSGSDYETNGGTGFVFNGIACAFSGSEIVSLTNTAGYTENYKVYASNLSNLGNHTLVTTTSVASINTLYYGKTTTTSGFTEADVEGLSNTTNTNDNTQEWNSITTGAGEYMLFAFPVRLGSVTFWVGGFEGGFESSETVSVTNSNGWNENYYVWRSTNSNLGSTVVTTT